MSKERMEPK